MDQEVRRIALYFSLCFYFWGGVGEGRVLLFSYKRPCSLYLEGRQHDAGMLADSGLLQN